MGDWISPRDIRVGARMRLFCLPHAGSGAAAYYRWKRLLPDSIDVVPVHLPGREARLLESPVVEFVAAVEAIVDAMRPLLDVPYAVFGHSMGSLLAYACALRLQGSGAPDPRIVFLSGREGAHLPFGHRDLHRLEDEAFLEALGERYGGMPAGFMDDPELREFFLPILRADLRLVESYGHAAGELLRAPVVALAGTEDASVSDAGLAAWSELVAGNFAWQRFAGDHFYHVGAGRDGLLTLIAAKLGTVSGPQPSSVV